MVLEYLIKVLENHNQGPGELNQRPRVLLIKDPQNYFFCTKWLAPPFVLKNKRWNEKVMSLHPVLYSKASLPKHWTASLLSHPCVFNIFLPTDSPATKQLFKLVMTITLMIK
jgi:hypothetical protein